MRGGRLLLVALALTMLPWSPATPQTLQELLSTMPRRQLRDFFEFRGRWVLDEMEGDGPLEQQPLGATLPPDLHVARELVITTTTTEFSVAKDGAAPEVYRLDGSEVQERDPRTGVGIDRFYRFTQVADAVALTLTHRSGVGVTQSARITTDAYSVAGRLMTVDRVLSTVVAPGSIPVIPDSIGRRTFVYRRVATK